MPDSLIHTIYIGADHRGYELKNQLKQWLTSLGYVVEDCSNPELDPADDFPPICFRVAHSVVADGPESLGITICGSGAGVVVASNKVKGALATLCLDPEMAKHARHDDHINVVCLASDFQSLPEAQEIIQAVISTQPDTDERFLRRLGEIKLYEQETTK